ncbi:MAG: triose-phosphate transporter family protein [Treponema sp.]|nr:triose-phosphate transporter family protein [Treponema sp.]
MNKNIAVLLLFVAVLISSISQIILKKAANKEYKSFIQNYLNIRVICAYCIVFTAVLIDLFAFKYVPVSFVPVIESSSYFFIIILSRIFLGEKLNLKQIIGISIIMLGVFLYV